MALAKRNLCHLRRPARVRSSSMGACLFPLVNKVEPRRTVRVEQGLLEGQSHLTADGCRCDVFLGIPYARPPVGELRFEKPQPPDQWSGIRKCKKFGSRCVQKDMPWDKVLITAPQSEDCLYLNVFAPEVEESSSKKFPVLFYIHGGGWLMDSAVRYTPKNVCRLLVAKGIIVVTLHYRLGYFGFLCTGDDVAKGNYGLYDMLEALKWTKSNISQFGGDPDNITLSGQSAGAASADLLSISPLARGLFAKKILMGGNSYCHWATTSKAELREYCRRKALKLGWKPQDEYASSINESMDMLNFFKQVPAYRLGSTMFFSKIIFTEAKLPLAPVIDGEILPSEIPALRAKAPDVPTIIGGGEYESLLFVAIGLMRCNEKEIERSLDNLATKTTLTKNQIREMMQMIYNDSPSLRENSKKRKKMFVEFISDVFLNYSLFQALRDSQKLKSDCYAYSFDHTSKNMWGWLQHIVPFRGGTHTSDVIYLFDCNYMNAPLSMDKTDIRVSEATTRYVTQFVKTGNPNDGLQPTWEPISKIIEDFTVLSVKEKPSMETKAYVERLELLEQGLEKVQGNKNDSSNINDNHVPQ